MVHAEIDREKPSAIPKKSIYLANPVFLLPRKIHMTVVMRTSTEADRVTPVVKIH